MAGASFDVGQWRDVAVVTFGGDIDVGVAAELGRRLARLQRETPVFVDLWGVGSVDSLCLSVLRAAKRRADDTGNDFAVIAPRRGTAAQQLEATGLDHELPVFETKHDAAAALRRV